MSSNVSQNARVQQLKTPRAAAVAGIVFAVLMLTSQTLIQLQVPADWNAIETRSIAQTGYVALALDLVPFAGIAFLWFIGVMRDRLGDLEDRFFATVYFGSALLYLAAVFMATTVAVGIVASYSISPPNVLSDSLYVFLGEMLTSLVTVIAIRMAAVFMISFATVWMRTRVMPRWLALLTYLMALGLLFIINASEWVALVFPFWVLVVSILILVNNFRSQAATNSNPPPA